MVKCWECQKDISDSAATCPSCGASQSRSDIASTAAPEPKKSGGVWKWVVGIPVGGFALVMAIGAMNSDPEKTQARRAYDQCVSELASADRSRSSTGTFIAGTCERMRADFVAKYGVNP